MKKKTKIAIIDFKLSSLGHIEISLNIKIKNTTSPYIPPEIFVDVDEKRLNSIDIWNMRNCIV